MASTYTMVAYGSQGSAVKQLQSELNRRGYSLDEDGIFGKKTRAAVRDYQKKNGLRRDVGKPAGIAHGRGAGGAGCSGCGGSQTTRGGDGKHGAPLAGAGEGLYALG